MRNIIIILAIIAITASACSAQKPAVLAVTSLPATEAIATVTPLPLTATASPVPPTDMPEPTLPPIPTVTLFPEVTFLEKVVCRMGPDANYYRVVTFEAGQTSKVQSRSEDGEWLIVLTQTPNKSFTCWVPKASVKDIGDVTNFLISVAPPLPLGPTSAISSKGVCGVNRQGAIVVEWAPTSNGTGFFVYRNGKNIASVYGGIYIDHDTPGSKTPYVYTYLIQAHNSAGLSKLTASVSVTLCD